jgi:hypothetical protein
MFKSSISDTVRNNRDTFEDVNRKYDNIKDDAEYTILDYGKITSDMCDYIEGYFKYKENGDEKYADKLIASTHKFFDDMFTDVKYRKPFNLIDMKQINEEFLANTKKLQTLLEADYKSGSEEYAILKMTDNQYNKLMKVYRDDVRIYIWLSTRYTPFTKSLEPRLIQAFENKNTPVIHKIEKEKRGDD